MLFRQLLSGGARRYAAHLAHRALDGGGILHDGGDYDADGVLDQRAEVDAGFQAGTARPYMLEETELLQLTRKSDHNDLVAKFVAAGLFPSE